MNGIPYMWDPKRNDTNELTYETERDSENELMVAGGDGWGSGWLGSLEGLCTHCYI